MQTSYRKKVVTYFLGKRTKWLFDLSSETPTILSTLGWLDSSFVRVVKQPYDIGELDELTGALWKGPRLLTNPQIFQYVA